MTDQEIRVGILSICKIKGSDSDINITGFHALCDKLKELGAVAERQRIADHLDECMCGDYSALREQVRSGVLWP